MYIYNLLGTLIWLDFECARKANFATSGLSQWKKSEFALNRQFLLDDIN